MSRQFTRVWEIQDPNTLFEAYLYHSFLYYDLNTNEIQDHDFDDLCRRLLEVFDKVDHPQRGLTDASALSAGTGFQMLGKYPKWVWDLARSNGHSVPDRESPVEDDRSSFTLGSVTLVGSRQTPQDVLQLMMNIGKYFCDTRFRGRSGGAPGADTYFYRGARSSANFDREIGRAHV